MELKNPDTSRSLNKNSSGLFAVIALHDNHKHLTELKMTLGDGFLYETSPLFKNVRDRVKAGGYRIIDELNEESRDFFMTSVFQFDKVILEKKLFARQNADALRYMARKCDHLSMQVSEVSLTETYSSLFHESVHCVFADRFGWKSLLLKDHADQKTYIEQIFTAESAALAFEYILCAAYHDPAERSLVFLNALGYQDAESLEAYRTLERMCGFEVAALWLFRGYFASNYFYEAFQPPPGLFQTVYNKCAAEEEKMDKAVGLMEMVFSIGFSLNKGFRNATAAGFFKMIGLKGNLKNAFQFDLFETLSSQAGATGCYLAVLKEMSQLKKLRASV